MIARVEANEDEATDNERGCKRQDDSVKRRRQ